MKTASDQCEEAVHRWRGDAWVCSVKLMSSLSLAQGLEKRLQKESAITQELHKQLAEREDDLEVLSKSVQQVQAGS